MHDDPKSPERDRSMNTKAEHAPFIKPLDSDPRVLATEIIERLIHGTGKDLLGSDLDPRVAVAYRI